MRLLNACIIGFVVAIIVLILVLMMSAGLGGSFFEMRMLVEPIVFGVSVAEISYVVMLLTSLAFGNRGKRSTTGKKEELED